MSISLTVTDLTKVFNSGVHDIEVLRGVSFGLERNESLAITGPSGSGKSTLLHVIGTLDTPTSGTVAINDEDPFALSEPDLARFRNEVIGFVFQDHYLLPQYSVLENVLFPTLASKQSDDTAQERALDLIERVNLADRMHHRPAELSGGERQRVAVARALINQPSLILCDEPTGNLDHNTADTVADLLFDLHQAEQTILILVTHSLDLAAHCGHRFELKEGLCVKV